MRVLLTGGTGFLGVALGRALRGAGHTVTVVSREPEEAAVAAVGWDTLDAAVREADALVNLAGEPIAAGRWTAARRAEILASRVDATRALVGAVAASDRRPSVLVNASAVGYYGPHGDEPLDETAGPGAGFLAEVCRAWEKEAVAAEPLGLRVVRLRIGIALAADGGALARMLPPFRGFVGGPLGSGAQWMSWIHRDDVTGLVVAALADEAYAGPVNATAPEPVTNRDFARAVGQVLVRPSWVRTPAVLLRLSLGQMAEMLLTGQRVLPRVAEERGYRFRYPDLTGALRASIRR